MAWLMRAKGPSKRKRAAVKQADRMKAGIGLALPSRTSSASRSTSFSVSWQAMRKMTRGVAEQAEDHCRRARAAVIREILVLLKPSAAGAASTSQLPVTSSFQAHLACAEIVP